MNETILSLAVMAKDEATATLNKIQASLGNMSKSMGLAEKASGALHDALKGIAVGVGIAVFVSIENVFSRLASTIPDLVTKGLQFADLVHKIGLETGASAQTTSAFVGSLNFLGIDADSAAQKLAIFSTNVTKHEAELNKLGIATRAADGTLLDQITLLDNVRHGLQGMADGTAKTALEQQLFGRSSQDLAPYLAMTDQQAQLLTQHLAETGQIMGEDTVENAKKASLSLNDLGGMIQGIANELIANVGPSLEQAVEGIAGFIHDNMTAIVNFAQGAIGFVLGLIESLTGVNVAMPSFIDNWSAAGSAASGAGAAFTQAGAAADGSIGLTNQTLIDQANFTKAQNDKVTQLGEAWKKAHASGASGAKAAKSAIDDETKSIQAQITAIQTLGTNQDRTFANQLRNIQGLLSAETNQLTQQDAIAQRQQRDQTLQQQIGTATDQLTLAEQKLLDVKNKIYAPDLVQRALDERQYTLDLASANQNLADAQERLANEPQGTTATQMQADQLAVQQAQLSIDELTHSRSTAVAQQQQDDKDAAATQIQAVTDATTAVQGAQNTVNDLKAQQTANAAQDAEDQEKAEIQATADKLTAIQNDEQNWTDKKGYLAQVQTDEATTQSQIEAAQKSGDVQKVHDLTILLQGLQTIETHTQEEIRNKNETDELQNQLDRLNTLKQAVADATTGSPGGIEPKFSVAGVQATISVANLGTAAGTTLKGIASGVGVSTDKNPATPAGAIGLLASAIDGTGPNSLTGAFTAGQTAGMNMANTLKPIFATLATTIGDIGTAMATFNSLVGGVDVKKIGLMVAAVGAATGNIPLAIAGLALYGVSVGAGQVTTDPATGQQQIPNLIPGLPGFHIPGHASGGWVGLDGPELSVVGESGPEFINPAGTGTGGSTTHNWNVNLPGVTNARQFIRDMEREMTKHNIPALVQR